MGAKEQKYTPKLWDYVSWTEEEASRYGQVTAILGQEITVTAYTPKEGEEDGITKGISAFDKLDSSTWAKVKMTSLPNLWEVGENVVVASMYHAFIKKNKLLGPENMSFLIADLVHEFITKNLAQKLAAVFDSYSLDAKTSGDFFVMTDVYDSLQKVPFVTVLQQAVQNLVFKKPFNHQLLSNILGNAGTFYVSNVGDRMMFSDVAKTPAYRYK